MDFQREDIDQPKLIDLYSQMLYSRLVEEKMLKLLRQGQISKWFSGIGQEAIAVGATLALEKDEYIMPLHRNLGVFTSRGMPLNKLFAQWQGKVGGYSKGRERSFHFGSAAHHICGMISHLGPQLSVAAGVALAHKLRGEKKISLAFSGEGGTSEGEFHEALNTAAVWKLPVIFLIENNGYGLSTPTSDQFLCKQLSDKAIGYGMKGITIDGNNILTVYNTIRATAAAMRENHEPVLIECMTFRMRGHEEASGTKYVPQELIAEWESKDPIKNYETWMLSEGILSTEAIETLRKRYKSSINEAVADAMTWPDPVMDVQFEESDMYALAAPSKMEERPTLANWPANTESKELRLVDSISHGLRQAMEYNSELVLMGQDIARYGGVFKITEGFLDAFGPDRVRNTTLCESAIVGIALGLSLKGIKSVVEMQFSDFVTCAFNQIVNNLAKIHYRWDQNADIVIRMPTGAGVGAGPFHSQSTEAWFFHVPGLKIVYPSNAYDAKGLLLAAIEDPNPVLFFEHKALYRSISDQVPDEMYRLPIGKANRVLTGSRAVIITYGLGVSKAIEVLNEMGETDIELIDLRSLKPWDKEMVLESVKKCSRVLVLHEDVLEGGIGAEIAAYLSEHAFEHLDSPVLRLGSLETAVPFSPLLEAEFLPFKRLKSAILKLLSY